MQSSITPAMIEAEINKQIQSNIHELDANELFRILSLQQSDADVENDRSELKDDNQTDAEAAVKRDLLERIISELDNNSFLFKDFVSGKYLYKPTVFQGKTFLVEPDEFEIDNNILIPGHRFVPYCDEDIFPSDIELYPSGSTKALKTKELEVDLLQVFHYHLLLGSEQVFDFFIAENRQNEFLLREQNTNNKIILNVFDLKACYEKYDFSSGDALLFTIDDWAQGKFTFTVLKEKDRREESRRAWVDELSNQVGMVIDQYADYPDIPTQLSLAFCNGRDRLFGQDIGTLDEFIADNDAIEISAESNHHAILVKSSHDEAAEPNSLPEGVSISTGSVDSLEAMLNEVNSPLKPAEIDAFILDMCYHREIDFDIFFQECFDRDNLTFADEAQEVAFMTALEERFETLTETYNRYDDEPKIALREAVLEQVEKRLNFMNLLSKYDPEFISLPPDAAEKLKNSVQVMNSVLEQLNSPSFVLDDENSEELEKVISDNDVIQDDAIDELTRYLDVLPC